MNTKVQGILEFNKVIDLLAEQAGSELTKDKISKLGPMSNLRMIEDALTETTEAVSVILYKGNIPVGEVGDIGGLLVMARKGRTLSMRELLTVKRSMQIAREVKNFLSKDIPAVPMLSEIASLIEVYKPLEDDIDRCILSEDEMADNASPELKRIRREMRNKNESIKNRLYKYTQSTEMQKYLQDAIVTMRNGRYVIPVKREYSNVVTGMVHDQSQTGSTLFIEPQAVVTLNNELKELEIAERNEIDRILRLFTSRVAEHHHGLKNNQKLLIELDFISAKGKLSCMMDANRPIINEDGIIDIKRGRHPLIPADKVVPINVSLGRDFKTLLITGPNTGGKTVTLKTIGLFVLMAQSGLHIPALDSSEIAIMDEVYADIGDEQSIEQSLSTFSSHMKNITDIFEAVTDNCLVLLDELGSGTDPSEGAALGIAELEELRNRHALVAATTHYTELKKYALSTPDVENASMEFDVETLSPTYRLRVGLPGKSNAFEIAGKLGLDPSILARASELLSDNEMEFEDAVRKVEEDRIAAEDLITQVEALKAEAEAKLREAEEELAKARAEHDKIVDTARLSAKGIIRDAKDTVEEVREELKKAKDDSKGHQYSAVADSRRKLAEAEKKHAKKKQKAVTKGVDPDALKIGMNVKIISLDQNCEVASLPDANGNLTVRAGILKMNANVKDLMIIENNKPGTKERKRRDYTKIKSSKARTISVSINLIGRNLDDATIEMEKYLDDAYLAGLKNVTVVHGRGEGILRDGLRAALKRNKHVKSFKSAPYNNGGEGATVVELKV